MKAYGYLRRDRLTCQYGCCCGKGHKARNDREVVDRQNRKSARQFAKKVAALAAETYVAARLQDNPETF